MESMRKAWKCIEDQFDMKLNELQIREEEIAKREKVLEDKESQYDAMEEVIIEKQLQVEQAKSELHSISLLVEEKNQELRKKERECALMQNSIKEGRNTLSRVEKSMREMEIKVKTSMEDWSCKVDLLERKIEGLLKPNVETVLFASNKLKEYFNEVESRERGVEQQAKDLQLKEGEIALKAEELKLTDTRVKECLNEVQLKEKSVQAEKERLDSLLKSTEKCKKDLDSFSHQLQKKETELAQQAEELKLKQKQFALQANSKHLEPTGAINNTTVPSSATDHFCINTDVTSNITPFLDNQKEPESSQTINAANLQPNTTRDERNVPGFLFENSNGNHSVQNDLVANLRSVPDPAKRVLDIIRSSIRPYLRKGYIEESVMPSNISLLKELMIFAPHVGSHLKEDARYLAIQWKTKMQGKSENSVESLAYFLFIATFELDSVLTGNEIVKLLRVISQTITDLELCQIHDFAAKMTGIIQNLVITWSRPIEAVKYILSFKLTENLPPIPLLKEYVEDAKEFCDEHSKEKTSLGLKVEHVDNRIHGLKAVQQCIKYYNLECGYLAADIPVQVVRLERLKEKLRSPVPSPGSNVQQEGQRKRKRFNSSTSTPKSQPEQQK